MKRFLGFLALLTLASVAHAQVKVSALPAGAALTGTEQVPVVQGGSTVRTTTSAIAALAGGGGTNPSTTFSIVEDFVSFSTSSAGSPGAVQLGNWLVNTLGAGSSIGTGGQTYDHPGVIALATGTTAGGQAWAYMCGLTTCDAMFAHASATITINFVAKWPTLPTATDEYVARLGIAQNQTPSLNYALARVIWDSGASAARWSLETSAAGSGNNNTAATGPAANTWYNIRLTITTGTVTMFVNGVQVAQNVAQIPTVGMSPILRQNKVNGTASTTMLVDLMTISQTIPARISP